MDRRHRPFRNRYGGQPDRDDGYGYYNIYDRQGGIPGSARQPPPRAFGPLPSRRSQASRPGLPPPLFDDRPTPSNIRSLRESRNEKTPVVAPSRAEGNKPAKPRQESNSDRDPDVGPSRARRTQPVDDDRVREDAAIAQRLAQQYQQQYEQEQEQESLRLIQRLQLEDQPRERHGSGPSKWRAYDEIPRVSKELGDTKGKGKARTEPESKPKPKPKPKTGYSGDCIVCMDSFNTSELLSPCEMSRQHYYCKDCLTRRFLQCLTHCELEADYISLKKIRGFEEYQNTSCLLQSHPIDKHRFDR